jgi:hypothetical protein
MVGGYLKDAGTKRFRTAFMKFVSWAQTNRANDYTVDVTDLVTFTTLNSGPAIDWLGNITRWTSANSKHAIICPYGSTATIACANAVADNFQGPVFVWGGASDTIFSTSCRQTANGNVAAAMPNDNCFGFFTPAAMYMQSGLDALATKLGGSQKVVVIKNSSPFSTAVAAGAVNTITSNANLVQQSSTVSVAAYQNALTAADETLIVNAMGVSPGPDIVVVAGHNGDVENMIIKIAQQSHNPKAILATNAFTNTGNYGSNTNYINCLMMPTQNDPNAANGTDPVTGWTVSGFTTLMGGAAPTYHEMAIGAVGVALANALDMNKNMGMINANQVAGTQLVARLNSMDVSSFYGRLNWPAMSNAWGQINKPMFTQQYMSSTNKPIVAPTGTANMQAGSSTLASATCWGAPSPVTTSGAFHGGFSVLVLFGTILGLCNRS